MQNVGQTIVSQYDAATTMQALIASMNTWIDPSATINNWYIDVWNILTASGAGLDFWGRVLLFPRVLQVAATNYLGFEQQAPTGIDTFGYAPFFAGATATNNVALADDPYRLALLAKAATNISNCSIPAINAILLALFPARGDAYVTDGENMTMTYHFTFTLTPVELAVVGFPGLLPRPTGVAATVVHP